MRIISLENNLLINNKNIFKIFSNSFGIPLTSSQISNMGLSNLQIFQKLFDSHKNFLAFEIEKNGKFGAINTKGEIYADLIYHYFSGVTPKNKGDIDCKNKQELYVGKKNGGFYDIYHHYELIFENAINHPYLIIDDFTKDEDNYRYANIETQNGYKIYDIFNKQFLNLTIDKQYNTSFDIHSQYEMIILTKREHLANRKFEYTCIIMDFDGNILGEYIGEYWLKFTEQKMFFETCTSGKCGIFLLQNGNFEKVIPNKYRKITQLFQNKAVVINTQNCIKIIHFEKKMKKGNEVWINKLDSYKLPQEVTFGFFLEDESEGILTLSNGKKILLSHFLKGNNKDFQCEDIIYKGNTIFKCYQFKGKDIANITFICNGQAVNSLPNNLEDGHIVETEENGKRMKWMFTPNGKKLEVEVPYYHDIRQSQNKKYCSCNTSFDFLTIPKDEWQNLVAIYEYGPYYSKNNMFNLIKGTMHSYKYNQQMIWHNIYIDNNYYDFHTIRGDEDFLNPFRKFIAGFNDYAIFASLNSIYLLDRNFNVTEFKNAKAQVDEIYKLCVISKQDESIVVSNNGLEIFNNTGKKISISNELRQVYKSKVSGNYVVGNLFVDTNLLKDEVTKGLIDKNLVIL